MRSNSPDSSFCTCWPWHLCLCLRYKCWASTYQENVRPLVLSVAGRSRAAATFTTRPKDARQTTSSTLLFRPAPAVTGTACQVLAWPLRAAKSHPWTGFAAPQGILFVTPGCSMKANLKCIYLHKSGRSASFPVLITSHEKKILFQIRPYSWLRTLKLGQIGMKSLGKELDQ